MLRRERGAAALLAFAVGGIAVSTYLTVLHYAALPPVCTTGGIVDCSTVLQSHWSMVPGTSIPVTVPGLLWFLVSGALAAVSLRSAAAGVAEPARLRVAHAAWSAAAMAGVFYLVYAELVELRRVCEWCTVVHLLVLASLLVAVARLQAEPEEALEAVEEYDVDPERAQPAARTDRGEGTLV